MRVPPAPSPVHPNPGSGSPRPTGNVNVLGLDGCPGGWVVAAISGAGDGPRAVSVEVADIPRVVALGRRADVVAIDIPMGLLDTGARACDIEARRLLGPVRGSSVFPAPNRVWLAARTHAEAMRLARKAGSTGMSRQAFNIVEKVRDVDAALRRHPSFRRRTHEVHPEIAFLLLNGGSVVESKKTPGGRAVRRQLLGREFGRATVNRLCQQTWPGCSSEDVLDALAVGWSAWRIARGAALALPGTVIRDAHGIQMRIWA